jgi:uncharacterized protein YggE
MRKLITLVGFVLLVSAGLSTAVARGAPANAIATPPDISVIGEGTAHGAPDTARMRLGVEVFGPSVAPADMEVDQRVSSVVQALRAANIPEAHIRTVGLSIAPQYDTPQGQPMALRGYIVRNVLEVEVNDVATLPKLIDGAIGAGANYVEDIRFESQNQSQLQAQARDQAWQSARTKAEQLARRAGVTLSRVTLVEEPLLQLSTTVRPEGQPGQAGNVLAPPAAVQSGEIEVRAQVHLVWSTE